MPADSVLVVGIVSTRSVDQDDIVEKVHGILERIRAAAGRTGRRPEAVRLVAATKFVPIDRIMLAAEAGVRCFGENRLQEALPKLEALRDRAGISWHFIGQLQRRKVKAVVGRFDLIHSVDGVELAREIDRRAGASGIRQAVLLEINVGREGSKAGVAPEDAGAALAALDAMPNLDVKGLMAIPPPVRTAEEARPHFRRLRELARSLMDASRFSRVKLNELSMGMSGDFEVAIEEGATIVRIGAAIFGDRPAGEAR
jgi:pyridoxal phosphate enzyme (YggS family)